MSQPILVVAGATATGKTEAALALARRYRGELIGADSVQVYRGFDIGSAKPSADELAGVAHHLIDVLDPDEFVDAMGYARRADEEIAAIQARGALPIVVGGTGLWIRALVRGLVDLPPVDRELRAGLEREAEREGAPALHARLGEVDPISAASIHPNDALRIVRALEVHAQTGRALGELRREHALGADRHPTFFVVLARDGATGTERIERRLEAMLAAGWVDEVRELLARWPRASRAFGSVGYKEIVAHLLDGVSLDETRAAIRKATRRYARRQRTWFASEPGITWRATPERLLGDEGARRVEAFLAEAGQTANAEPAS